MTPARSAAGRFWLAFHLPRMSAISISTPTICRTIAATKSSGASLTAHGAGRADSWDCVSAAICRRSQRFVLDHARDAARLDHHVVPGRHDLAGLALGRVPGRRDVMVGALKHDQRLARPCRSRHCPLARAMWARSVPNFEAPASMRNGIALASEALRPMADEKAERMAADQLVLGGEIVLAVKRGFVHGRAPRRGFWRPRR